MRESMAKNTYLYAFLLCWSVIAAAFLIQETVHLKPCPLCLVQRFIFMLLSGFFFLLFVLPQRRKIYMLILQVGSVFLSCLGIIVSGRHLWLQQFGTVQNSCAGDLIYLLKHFPLQKIMIRLFNGAGNCATIDWQFLSLSMPAWALLFFIFFAAFSSYHWVVTLRKDV